MTTEIDSQVALLENNLDNYKLVMNISGAFTLFSMLMSIYLIQKSPDVMNNYKPYLLNIVVSR
jgi:hypothetical protein